MPFQTVEVKYESDEVVIEQEWSNLSADILIKPGANGTPTLDLLLTHWSLVQLRTDMSAFFMRKILNN